jgi:hypothetical protein
MNSLKSPPVTTLLGLAFIGLMITGALGCVHAFQSGSGLGLIAAALSFGVIFVTLFK